MALMLFAPRAAAAGRPVIYSKWTSSPPTIDGNFLTGEPWTSSLQITMLEPSFPVTSYVYMLNDNTNLYVLVDAVDDHTSTAGDASLLVFDFTHQFRYKVVDQSGFVWNSVSFSYVAYSGAVGGFGASPSPNGDVNHRIYEFKIPLSDIDTQAGQVVDFSAPTGLKGSSIVYDDSTTRDNIWPSGLNVGDITTWGLLATSTQIATATGSTAIFASTGGFSSGPTASALSSVSPAPPAGLTFPYGLFSFIIGEYPPGTTVYVTITLPSPLPAGSFSYWKFQSGAWTQFSSASLEPTRTIITLTFTADASGMITDPGGPAILTGPPPSAGPVGGAVEPVNKLTVIAPYLAVFGMVAAVAVIIVTDRKHGELTNQSVS